MTEREPPRRKSGLSLEEFYEEFQTLVKDPEDRISILTGRSHKSGKSEGRQFSGGDEAAKMAEQVSPDDVGSLVDSPDVITGDNGVKFEIQKHIVYKEVITKYEELIEEEEEYDDRHIRPADDDEVEKEYKTRLTEKEEGKTEIETKTETEVVTKEEGGERETESSGEKTESGGEKRTEGSWRTKTEVSWETKTERSSGEKRTESGGGEKRTESGGGEKRTESGGEKSTEGSWRTKTEVSVETKTERSGGEERTGSGGGEKRTEGSWRTKTEVSVETKTEKSAGEKSGGGEQKEEKTTESEKCHQCNLMESSWGKRIESGGEGGRKEGRKEGTTRDDECEDGPDECRCTPMEIVIDDRSTYNEHDTAEPYPDDLFRVLIERERHLEEEEEEEDERQRKIREFSCQPKVSKKRRKKKRKKRLETTSEKRRREASERRRRNKEAVEAWIRKKNIERKKVRENELKKNQEDEKQCVMLKLMRNPQLAYQAFLRAKNLERLKNYPKSITITCESFEIWLQRCFKRRYNMESFMNW